MQICRIKRKRRLKLCIIALIIASASCGYGTYHRVKKGESLKDIAEKYSVPEEDIIKENSKYPWGFDPQRVKEGDYVYIPLDKIRKIKENHNQQRNYSSQENYNLNSEETRQKSNPESQTTPEPTNPPTPEKTELASLKKKDSDLKIQKPHSPPAKKIEFTWPVDGKVISQFGQRGSREHKGIDIKAPEGTPIKASADGVVIFSGFLKGYGNVVIIKHEGDFFTVYAHNKLNTVKEGDFVKKSQEIGKVGMTGNAQIPHLHFEIRRKTQALNPLIFLQEKGLSNLKNQP